jgi:hypothetical protein
MMGVSVCPAAIVAAPVELVWANLVQWERYYEWAGVRVASLEPDGQATAGQTVIFGVFSGKAFGRKALARHLIMSLLVCLLDETRLYTGTISYKPVEPTTTRPDLQPESYFAEIFCLR